MLAAPWTYLYHPNLLYFIIYKYSLTSAVKVSNIGLQFRAHVVMTELVERCNVFAICKLLGNDYIALR